MIDDGTRGTDILIGQLTIDQGLTNNKKSEQCDPLKSRIGRFLMVSLLASDIGDCGRSLYQFPHPKSSASRPHPHPLSRARERGAEGGVRACWHARIQSGTILHADCNPEPQARNLTAASISRCWMQTRGNNMVHRSRRRCLPDFLKRGPRRQIPSSLLHSKMKCGGRKCFERVVFPGQRERF